MMGLADSIKDENSIEEDTVPTASSCFIRVLNFSKFEPKLFLSIRTQIS